MIGPLGNPTEVENYGSVACIGSGVGTPEVFPVAEAMKNAGNDVIVISGFRTKDLVILEDEMEKVCIDEFYITTDDGTYGREGFTSDVLEELIERREGGIDLVRVVGPPGMMKVIADITRKVTFRRKRVLIP